MGMKVLINNKYYLNNYNIEIRFINNILNYFIYI